MATVVPIEEECSSKGSGSGISVESNKSANMIK
jgi:hypothetical protein